MNKIPDSIKLLTEKRKELRSKGDYRGADVLRTKIEDLGYRLVDKKEKTFVKRKKKKEKPKNNFLVLFGSGEISASGRRIHEFIFKKMKKDRISIAIIGTPAGFQPNVKTVYEEIADFFYIHLQNFHPQIEIIYANDKEAANDKKITAPLEGADYIFTGPGSPTYALKNLKNTLLFKKIKERIRKGATLSLASAAVAAFSRYCLPVYEIYKAGEKLHWQKGLNFYKPFFEATTIIPHFNNNEGGEKNDTSRCFMGQERFQRLLKLLPKEEKIIGIDEHTAAIFDIQKKKFITKGKGIVHSV